MSPKSNDKNPTLVLIDANALVHRAYHAFPPTLALRESGQPVNAVYGFTVLLLDVLNKFEPEYAICAFDTDKPTIRHTEFSAYKAHRKPIDTELISQFPIVYDVVEAFNIPLFRVEGFEADDIIGTLAKSSITDSLKKIVVTGDADLLQLVDEDINVFMAGTSFSKSRIYDREEVTKKYGFGPDYVIDYKAIKGDPSDNIPGVKGIGDKGAKDLIEKFGHIDDIYKNIQKIDSRHQKKLVEQHEEAKLSEHLATIMLDVPLSFKLKDAKLKDYDVQEVKSLFQKLEFRSLIRKLPESENGDIFSDNSTTGQSSLFAVSDDNNQKGKKEKPSGYELVDSEEAFKKFIAEIKTVDKFAFDVESSSLDHIEAEVFGISFSWKKSKAFYLTRKLISEPDVLESLKLIFEDKDTGKVAHNLKYDMHMMKNIGIDVKGDLDDTLLCAYLLQEGEGRLGLKELAFNKLGMVMDTLESVAGSSMKNGSLDFSKLDETTLGVYSCADADATWQLFELFTSEFEKELNKKLYKLYKEIEMPVATILMKMERVGITLDTSYLKNFKQELIDALDETTKEIYELIGHEFNIKSPKQVGEVLFEELGLPGGKKTKTGSFSTNERILRDLTHVHEIVPKILRFRELEKLRSTYTEALIDKVKSETGRIYTQFNQAVTTTGRLSSSDPNLQNIPISTDKGMKIRRAFVAGEGRVFLGLDIAQQELRVAAILSNEENLINAFKEGVDIHKLTASMIYDVPVEKVLKNQRRVGKTLNFSLLYGISAFGLADRLKVEREEAQDMIDTFWASYPSLKSYFDKLIEDAKEYGFVETYYGRRRNANRLKSSNFRVRSAAERELVNFPIQGTSADLMKMSMIAVDDYLANKETGLEARVVLQVHDELILELDDNLREIKKLASVLKVKMEGVVDFEVPILVEPRYGKNWADLEPLEV